MDTFFLAALIVLVIGLGAFVIASVRLERAHRLTSELANQNESRSQKII